MNRKLLFALIGFLAFMTGCASSAKAPPDSSVQRLQAQKGYDELDREMNNNGALDMQSPAAAPVTASANPSTVNNQPAMVRQQQPAIVKDYEGPKPTLMVLPATKAKEVQDLLVIQNEPSSKAMMEAINAFLTQKHYEVKSLEGQGALDELIQMQQEIAGDEEDFSYLASLALGADVYLTFSGSVQGEMVVAEVNAYETATARLLGSQTSEVKNNSGPDANLRALSQSAARKAMPGLEKKILAYWSADQKNGVQYKAVIKIKGSYSNTQIEDVHDAVLNTFKSIFNKVSVNSMTSKTMDLIIYADPQKYADSHEVYSAIRNSLKSVASISKNNISRKLLLMDLQ